MIPSHISSHNVFKYYQKHIKHRKPLSVLPDGPRTLQTLPRTPMVIDHQSDLDIHDEPCAFYKVLLVSEP
jgi:hypothetical protein